MRFVWIITALVCLAVLVVATTPFYYSIRGPTDYVIFSWNLWLWGFLTILAACAAVRPVQLRA